MKTICALAALVCIAVFPARVQAAATKHWVDRAQQLSLSYPGDWHLVAEHGAVVKLVSADAAGEFEIFALQSQPSSTALASTARAALGHLHCATAVQQTALEIGLSKFSAQRVAGSCTGSDKGWTLAVVVFNHGSGALLTRGWIFHAQPHDTTELQAIVASLASVQ